MPAAEPPLLGRRIVITRPRSQGAGLADALRELGADVLHCPAIRVVGPRDPAALERAVAGLAGFAWVVLTSVNGVRAFFDEVRRQQRPAEWLRRPRYACVGPATEQALRAEGITPAQLPAEYVGVALAQVIGADLRTGERVLLARAAGANPDLPAALLALGAEVVDVESYRSVPDEEGLRDARRLIEEGGIDLVAFTSPSTVTYFHEAVGGALAAVPLAAIGPVTAARLAERGLVPGVVAASHDTSGLVATIAQFLQRRAGGGVGNERQGSDEL